MPKGVVATICNNLQHKTKDVKLARLGLLGDGHVDDLQRVWADSTELAWAEQLLKAMDQPAEQNASGDVRLLQSQGDFLG